MIQEDKDLLLKDLCARLPYGVKCLVNYTFSNETTDYNDVKSSTVDTIVEFNQQTESYFFKWLSEWFDFDEFKPYLFPLSSMTEEQRNDVSKLLIDTQKEFPPYGELNIKGCDNLFICTVKQANVLINYCLTHHLDINGLIPKGLAIDATGLNIY